MHFLYVHRLVMVLLFYAVPFTFGNFSNTRAQRVS
jgi:hypothetical protein